MKLNLLNVWLLIFIASTVQALKSMDQAIEQIKPNLIGGLLSKLKENPLPRHVMHHCSMIRNAQLASNGHLLLINQGSNNKDDSNFFVVWDLVTGKKRHMIPQSVVPPSFLSFGQELPSLTTPSKAVITFQNNTALFWDEEWKAKALNELLNLSLIQKVVLQRAFEANQRNEYYILDMKNEDHVEELAALRRISYETRQFLKKNKLYIFIRPQTLIAKLSDKFGKFISRCS